MLNEDEKYTNMTNKENKNLLGWLVKKEFRSSKPKLYIDTRLNKNHDINGIMATTLNLRKIHFFVALIILEKISYKVN